MLKPLGNEWFSEYVLNKPQYGKHDDVAVLGDLSTVHSESSIGGGMESEIIAKESIKEEIKQFFYPLIFKNLFPGNVN